VWWKLHDPNFNRFWLIHPCDGQTDIQTDGRIAIAYARLAYMLSRAKSTCTNNLNMPCVYDFVTIDCQLNYANPPCDNCSSLLKIAIWICIKRSNTATHLALWLTPPSPFDSSAFPESLTSWTADTWPCCETNADKCVSVAPGDNVFSKVYKLIFAGGRNSRNHDI